MHNFHTPNSELTFSLSSLGNTGKVNDIEKKNSAFFPRPLFCRDAGASRSWRPRLRESYGEIVEERAVRSFDGAELFHKIVSVTASNEEMQVKLILVFNI